MKTKLIKLSTLGGFIILLVTMALAPPAIASYEDALKIYMQFNEASGGIAYDATTNANNGTITGATVNQAGKFGSAYSFDGTNDAVTVATPTGVSFTNAHTLSAWVKTPELTTMNNIITKFEYTDETHNSGYMMFLHGGYNDALVAAVAKNDLDNAIGTSDVMDTAWHLVTATYDAGTLKVYVDGSLETTVTGAASTLGTNNRPFNIGGQETGNVWDAGRWFNGTIDEVAAWSRPLSVDEIRQVKNFGVEAFQYLLNDFGYTTVEMDQIWNAYQTQGSTNINGTTWSYTANPLTGHLTGDVWAEGGKTIIKLGSGMETPEIPAGVALPLLALLGSAMVLFKKRIFAPAKKK